MLAKRYLKSKNTTKVTFYTPTSLNAEAVYLVGDFNEWSESATPMELLKDGRFKVVIELEPEKEYQFRYLVNGDEWHNDAEADRYVPNPYGGDNSVVTT
jgi:1,4-alpha-glucan branching enzyme